MGKIKEPNWANAKNPDWIICNQRPEVLGKYPGPVIWVNQCLRCHAEEPVYEGRLKDALSQSKGFIKIHRSCKP